jgi:ubiquinone/menaquinone biosynthesis C-methylase UbiE
VITLDTSSLNPTDLRKWLDSQPWALGSGWVTDLEPRKQEEAGFHDADRIGHKDEVAGSTPNRRFYESANHVGEYMEQWFNKRVPGTVFLDYACGNGIQTLRALKHNAVLGVGIDVSEVSVSNARETASRAGVADRAYFLQRDCENTGLPDNSFTSCLCSGMLHHLDLNRALPELHRIMAPGGRVLAMEALAYNPFIRLYRSRTPELRTEWESQHILSLKDVKLAQRWFRVENIKYFLMAAPLATLLPSGMPRSIGLQLGHAIDAIATRIPLLQLWSWQFSFELVKPT